MPSTSQSWLGIRKPSSRDNHNHESKLLLLSLVHPIPFLPSTHRLWDYESEPTGNLKTLCRADSWLAVPEKGRFLYVPVLAV